MRNVLEHLRKVLPPRADSGASDWELLERFALTREETAFEVLVWRHHQMVLNVCRRALADADAVEDAFQACFLVLARKAGRIQRRGSLSSWLYGVARRVALEARRASRRGRPTLPPAAAAGPEPWEELDRQELRGIFDEELGRLPEKYRAPVVLCYLRGMTYEEAARQLGCPTGTVSTRLTRARELLRRRLTGRGLALSAGPLAAWLCAQSALAGTSSALVASTTRSAAAVAAGKAVASAVVSPSAAALAEGVLRSLSLAKLKIGTAVLLGALLLAAGAGALAALLAEPWGVPAPRTNAQRPAQVGAPGDGLAPPDGRPTILLTGHRDQIMGIAYSPDGRLIATSGLDKVVLLWDAATGQAKGRFDITPDAKRYRGTPALSQIVFSPDGKLLAAGRGDGVVVWDLATQKEVQRFDSADCIAFSPDGKLLACGGWDLRRGGGGLIQLFDRGTGKLLRELRGHLTPVEGLTFAPDGRSLFSRGRVQRRQMGVGGGVPLRQEETKHVRLWDLATGGERRGFAAGDPDSTEVSVSPDGRTLAEPGWPIKLVETATGGKRAELTGHKGHVYSVAFAPDGRTLASAGGGGTVWLWALPSGKEIGRLEGHRGWVRKVAFAPDGRALVSGGLDGTARVWDVSRFTRRRD
jgi:RNA polymerase sigma factor (sigma-70 family)